jgi:hypothetical protein
VAFINTTQYAKEVFVQIGKTLDKPVSDGVALSLYASCQNLSNAVSCRMKFHPATPELNCPLLAFIIQIIFFFILIATPILACDRAYPQKLA